MISLQPANCEHIIPKLSQKDNLNEILPFCRQRHPRFQPPFHLKLFQVI